VKQVAQAQCGEEVVDWPERGVEQHPPDQRHGHRRHQHRHQEADPEQALARHLGEEGQGQGESHHVLDGNRDNREEGRIAQHLPEACLAQERGVVGEAHEPRRRGRHQAHLLEADRERIDEREQGHGQHQEHGRPDEGVLDPVPASTHRPCPAPLTIKP
jgi:hypothetical protein